MTIICTGRCARGLRGKVATIVGLLMLLNGSIDAAIFMVENADDAGLGSLRQAILSANALPGPDEIHFNIPGPGPHIIVPLTELPPLVDPTTIDATTQPGFSGVPLVALDGGQATLLGIVAGVRILGGNSTVRGLMIYQFGSLVFSGSGISMQGNGNNVIEGNYIGLDPWGDMFAGNSIGIECLNSSNNRVGGPQPASRNVISGNFWGIEMGNNLLTLGSNNLVQGNFIGTAPNGTSRADNIADGILITGGQMNRIVGNRIAFNEWSGIRVTGTNSGGNTFSQNVIYDNGRLGINLQPPGEADASVTPNDSDDSDTGPNSLQNFPVIGNVSGPGGSTVITGQLISTPNHRFMLEFYRSTRADPSGFGQGEVYLGSTLATTDVSGIASFTFTVGGTFLNQYFTATATDQETGDTSEFSQAVQAKAGTLGFEPTDYRVNENDGSAVLTVARVGGTYGDVSVDFATENGTAIGGSDFVSASGTLSFRDGEAAHSISIALIDDQVAESDESFTVKLSAPTGGALLGADSSATVLIVDDDPQPQMNINDVVITEGTDGTLTANFGVSLSSANSKRIMVSYATADGTALAGTDYDPAQGTLIFRPGQTVQSIPVTIASGQLQTVEKRFFMNLSQCVNATLQSSQGQCTIRQLRLLITRNAGEIMLQFPTGTAQSYALEQNTDLNDRLGWRALAGADSLQGTGEVLTFRDTAQGHGRCYRVRLLP